MQDIEWTKPGLVRVGAGAMMDEIDAELRPTGWELRMHPPQSAPRPLAVSSQADQAGSDRSRMAVCASPANIVAARIVTLEETPRVLELRGDAAQKINRAYGTTGVITALEMPLAPAWEWIDMIVAFDDFFDAVEFGREVAMADGVVKRVDHAHHLANSILFRSAESPLPEGKSILIMMIAQPWVETVESMLGARGRDDLSGAKQ